MTRRRDIKKSDFPLINSSRSTDTFDLIRNNQNFRIAQADLVSDFGATGTITTRGEATAVPVLTIIADVNYIRNILGGSGVRVSLSPQDGIQLDHNFTADNTGVPVLTNTAAASPTIRSLQAGDGISISGAGGIIQITATDAPESSKTVFVYDINDFPEQVSGVITLLDETEYRLQSDVSSAYRYVMGSNTVLSGADRDLVTLEYTGAGTMITAADVSCKVKDIGLACDSGTMFEVSSTTGLHNFLVTDSLVTCDNVGTFTDLLSLYIKDSTFNPIYTEGFQLFGNFSVVVFDSVGIVIPSGAGNGIDFGTCVMEYFTADKILLNTNTTGYSLVGAADSANISATGLGLVINSRNFGTSDVSLNIYPTDDRWDFSHNTRAPNSYDAMLATHAGATIAIAAAATPVIVGATWVTHKTSRFDTVIGGRWTYTGIGTSVSVTATITADLATGIDNVSFFLYKNGVQIADSVVTREFDAGNPGNLSLVWDETLDTNDYLELWVQNDDTNVDIDIVNATMRIRS